MRRTKIVCTIGPSTIKDGIEAGLSPLAAEGMNVVRMNMSYAGGEYQMEKDILSWARNHGYRINNRTVAILADLQGIKYRIRGLPKKKVTLATGQRVRFVDESTYDPSQPDQLPMPSELHRNLLAHLSQKMERLKIYLGDGDIILFTEQVEGDEVLCSILIGGVLKEGKGITLQGIDVTPTDSLTDKDKRDVRFLMAHRGVTFIALSFVQSGEDIRRLRRFIVEECGCSADQIPPIIAKIETRRGYQNLEDILDEAYGIMVARGDLGLQVGVEKVTELQKDIIHRCILRAKPVITATQMLESMETSLEPKRAEASDIFNAILDGTDAVMLSGETSAGRYPREAVEMMARIVTAAEDFLAKQQRNQPANYFSRVRALQAEITARDTSAGRSSITAHLISHAAAVFAATPTLEARGIIAPTASGTTPRLISRYRPPITIIAAAHKLEIVHQLALSYGVDPVYIRRSPTSSVEQIFALSLRQAVRRKFVLKGDVIVFSGGYPMWKEGTTNLLKIHIVTEEDVTLRQVL